MANKIITYVIATMLCMWYAPCYAREMYFQKPVPLAAGTEYIDSIYGYFSDFDYHCRIELPPKSKISQWCIALDYNDNSRTVIRLARDGAAAYDSDYSLPLSVKTCTSYPKHDSVSELSYLIDHGIDNSIDGWSVLLSHIDGDTLLRCSVGQRSPLLNFSVRAVGLTSVTTCAETPLNLSRLSLFVKSNDAPAFCRFDDISQLAEYISSTEDPNECFWKYLDRDTDLRRLNTGGDYKLATVRNHDGSYDIVYLDGARSGAKLWEQMRIKGRLIPTAFANHYDLIWYDAFGNRIDKETSADISDGAILKLSFPLQGGCIRFQRNIMP